MRTVDPDKHAAKRRHIIDAAASCFARAGFDRTTVADICTAAGISSGSLFHYFPTKRAVFTAIFEQDGRDNAARLAAAADSDDPWGAVLGHVEHAVSSLEDPTTAGLAFEVVAQAGRDSELAELVMADDRRTREGLAVLLERAARMGQIDPPVEPATAAHWVMGLADAMYTRTGVDSEFAPGEQGDTLRLILARFLGAEPR